MTNSFYMHPKYQEFLGSIKNLESDARVNPNSLNLAFDVWLLGGNMSESKEQWLIAENARLTKENEQLVRDMHRIDSEPGRLPGPSWKLVGTCKGVGFEFSAVRSGK